MSTIQDTEPPQAAESPDSAPPDQRSPWSRFWRHRAVRWVAGLVLVLLLIVGTIAAFSSATSGLGPNDPRSSLPEGAGAVGAVLGQEGVDIRPTNRVDDAVRDGAGATIVVAFPESVSEDQARRLMEIPNARLILLAPLTATLTTFGIEASAVSDGELGPARPECTDPSAQRAGTASFSSSVRYNPAAAPAMACYPSADGFGYLRFATAAGGEVELIAGGWTNRVIANDGNAALITGAFGTRERLVWLLQPVSDQDSTGLGGEESPTLLPSWWPMAMVQAFVALIIVGVWRGRRLGPILVERLPVRVRASETVEGHGRLYDRLNARERAASALRDGVIHRLSRRYGHGNDPMALAAALAERTGRDSRQVHQVLFGPVPIDDDQLLTLTKNLDDLEQEARRP